MASSLREAQNAARKFGAHVGKFRRQMDERVTSIARRCCNTLTIDQMRSNSKAKIFKYIDYFRNKLNCTINPRRQSGNK